MHLNSGKHEQERESWGFTKTRMDKRVNDEFIFVVDLDTSSIVYIYLLLEYYFMRHNFLSDTTSCRSVK